MWDTGLAGRAAHDTPPLLNVLTSCLIVVRLLRHGRRALSLAASSRAGMEGAGAAATRLRLGGSGGGKKQTAGKDLVSTGSAAT